MPEETLRQTAAATEEKETSRPLASPEFFFLLQRMGRMEEKLGAKIDAVDEKLNARIDTVEKRLSARIDGLEAKMQGTLKWVIGLLFTSIGLYLATLGLLSPKGKVRHYWSGASTSGGTIAPQASQEDGRPSSPSGIAGGKVLVNLLQEANYRPSGRPLGSPAIPYHWLHLS